MVTTSGLRRFLGTCLSPHHLRRTGLIALVVGTWLTLLNQGDTLWVGQLGGWIWVKIVLNYLTPFVMSNLDLLSKEPKESDVRREQKRLETRATSGSKPQR